MYDIQKATAEGIDWTTLDKIKIGDTVKVSLPGEAAWFQVTKVSPEGFTGKVINSLIGILHPYKHGDEVQFRWSEHFKCFLSIYEIEKEAEKLNKC